jgi:hypothetical protein
MAWRRLAFAPARPVEFPPLGHPAESVPPHPERPP